jgi:hypothetical protein
MATIERNSKAKTPRTTKVLIWTVTEPLADFLFGLSNVVLVVGAAAVLVGTIGAIAMGGAKERFSNERISANEAETARANERTAHLEHESEVLRGANLALQEKIAPRQLSEEQMNAAAAALSQHAGKSIFLRSYALDMEGARFGQQLMAVFSSAHITVIDSRLSVSGMGSISSGIRISGKDEAFGVALAEILHAENIAVEWEATPMPVTGLTLGAPPAAENADITVFIGVRPLPE